MLILNLGCGSKTSEKCVNIDRSIHLIIANNPVLRAVATRALSKERVNHINHLRTNIRMHDLRKGIPYSDDSVDAVYHSHVFEHIDRDIEDDTSDPARMFVAECRRVLKPGGILRIVVPDLEGRCRRYLAAVDKARRGEGNSKEVTRIVDEILGQAVRKEASGTRRQRPLLRRIENVVLGDARRRGETHQWEYDAVCLGALLQDAGFSDISQVAYNTSRISGWGDIGLDLLDGLEYKPGSLYMEAVK